MSIIDNCARNLIRLAENKPDAISYLDRRIVREQNQLSAAALILARKHFTETKPPPWGSVSNDPQPERRNSDVPQKARILDVVREKRFISQYNHGDIRREGPSSQTTMTGYRDADGQGSCYVVAPPTVFQHSGWKTGLIRKRKYYNTFDLK